MHLAAAAEPLCVLVEGRLEEDRSEIHPGQPSPVHRGGGDLTLKGRHVAAKTGTTNDFKDNWTIGFTPSLVTAVWVGNPDNKPLSHNSTGIVGAAPIWHKFMTQALGSTADQWYSQPAGLIASGGNYFLPGTQSLPPTLGQPWPQCKLPAHYNPYSLTYAQITVDGVYCVLNAPKPAAPPAAASPAPTPAPSPTSCPNGILPNGQCKPQD